MVSSVVSVLIKVDIGKLLKNNPVAGYSLCHTSDHSLPKKYRWQTEKHKQNIVFTNRRSRETQDILDKILKTPEEIKVNKDKEAEAMNSDSVLPEVNKEKKSAPQEKIADELSYDVEAVSLMKKYHTFGRKTPEYMLINAKLADDE